MPRNEILTLEQAKPHSRFLMGALAGTNCEALSVRGQGGREKSKR